MTRYEINAWYWRLVLTGVYCLLFVSADDLGNLVGLHILYCTRPHRQQRCFLLAERAYQAGAEVTLQSQEIAIYKPIVYQVV